MSNSWAHTLRPLTDDELARLRGVDEVSTTGYGWTTCKAGRRCPNEAKWMGSYRYVTGRLGRVSFAEKRMCDDHATKFRAKYDPAEVEGLARRAIEHAVSTFFGEAERTLFKETTV